MTYYDPDSGHFLSVDHMRIAEIIQDYDPRLMLVWIPPQDRTETDTHPYAIVETTSDGLQSIVMRIRENEMDHRILTQLFLRDNAHANVLDRIEAETAAIRALEMKKYMDDLEEAHELARWAVKTPLHYAKHNGVKFDTPNGGRE